MRLLLVIFLASVAGTPLALAQAVSRSPVLKQWPSAGRWSVLMVETQPSGGAPACLLMAGDNSRTPADLTRWGFRYNSAELRIIEHSLGAQDPATREMAITVDGRSLGAFAISERPPPPPYPPSVVKYVSAIASVDDPAARQRIVSALRAGSVVRMVRGDRVFEEALDARAVSYFEECGRELAR